MKKWLFICALAMAICTLTACNAETSKDEVSIDTTYAENVKENPIVTITMENDEEIEIELYPKTAPITVANFVDLVEQGFYDGLIFHRVIEGFMIQGGDPDGNGTGGSPREIKGEFSANGVTNDLQHTRGVISMARSNDFDGASSQFFIMHADEPQLDGDYAAFGKVISGMDVVDTIATVETGAADKPVEEQVMKSVTIDTKGFEYPRFTE